MQAGEDTPLHTCELQSARVLTEAAATLGSNRGLNEVAVAEVVVEICIPRKTLPSIGNTFHIDVHARVDVGLLVVGTGVALASRRVVVESERSQTEAAIGIDEVLTKLLRELQACVAENADLLVEHRACERLHATDTVDEEHGHTSIGTIIALRNAVEGVGEGFAECEVLVELIARSDNSIEVGHLHTVLVDGATIVE